MSKYYCKKCKKWHSPNYKKHWAWKDREKVKTPASLEQCTKQDLLRRIQECMTRMFGKMPDVVISEMWDDFKIKTWFGTPFLYLHYEEYDDSREI